MFILEQSLSRYGVIQRKYWIYNTEMSLSYEYRKEDGIPNG